VPRRHPRGASPHELFSEQLELHVIELPKVSNLPEVLDHQVRLVRWGRFLAAQTDQEREEIAMQDPAIREAKDTLDLLSEDPVVQDIARRREEGLALYHVSMRAAEAKGRAEGRAESRAEGRAETLRKALGGLCEVLGIELDDRKRQALAGMSDTELETLFDTLTRERRWPG